MEDQTRAIPGWIKGLFAAIDRAGVEGMLDVLHEDVAFRFGSFPPGRGRDTFRDLWGQMSTAVESMQHTLIEAWEMGDTSVCRGDVTYYPVGGDPVRVPFANVMKKRDGLIVEYLIYVDASAVFGIPPVIEA